MVADGKISISGEFDQFNAIKIEGSAPDGILKTYFKEDQAFVKKWKKLKEEYDTHVTSRDTVFRKKLA